MAKTLHQLREEKREFEEHQEAMRLEQLAQDLADAQAAEGAGSSGEGMSDVQLDGTRDLDDDIPDADEDGFGFDDDDDEEEDDDDDDDEEDDDEDGEDEDVRRNQLVTARMRLLNDDILNSGSGAHGGDMYVGQEELDEEREGHMLAEDDLVHDAQDDMGMGADLDDDIPEAESGGYEHTDSEAGFTSSEAGDEEEEDLSHAGFAPRSTAPLRAPQSPPSMRPARTSGVAPRSSMDISGFLSRDGGSFLEQSPRGAGR